MFARAPMLAFRGAGGGGSPILRPQDVFATSLYSGDGTSKKITLPFQPDLVWEKRRNIASRHILTDSARGPNVYLDTSATDAELSRSSIPGTFYSDGYAGFPFSSGDTAVGWALKQQAKFFVRVTYTGDGTSGRVIPHALGIDPGMGIVRRRDAGDNWRVRHRSASGELYLNLTDAQAASFPSITATSPTSFTVGAGANVAGATYVAYLVAHDPDTTNGIVQCVSLTLDSSGNGSYTFPWPVQLVLEKASTTTSQWIMMDTARKLDSTGANFLYPNLSAAEDVNITARRLNGNTFSVVGANGAANQTFILLAIRAPI